MNKLPRLFIVSILTISILSTGLFVQEAAASNKGVLPTNLLNPDGTLRLDKSTSGTLDLAGWKVNLDLQRGPILTPTTLLSPGWNALGSALNNEVYAIAINGSDVYVGGNFTNAGSIDTADYIAKWNGSTWSALGSGLNGYVEAIAISGSNVYVGGAFTDAGSVANTSHIAMWNGSFWSALDVGLDGYVYDITISGSDVYVAGSFLDAGEVLSADNIAKWDGYYWAAVGGGLNERVICVAVNGSTVYAGGVFTDAGGDSNADYIAKFDGVNWSALGGPLTNAVYDIAISGSNVYVGGSFTNAGGLAPADYIARWNGSNWYALGTGMNGSVKTIAINGSNVYVGGSFSIAGGSPNTAYNAKWNGSSWAALGSGLNDTVYALAAGATDIYAGGAFTNAGGIASADYVARYHPPSQTFKSNGTNDGWVLESSEISGKGGTMNNTSTVFYLGDNTQNRQYRAILSFDTSGLPNTAIITKVTLKIKKQGLVGNDPFSTHGNIAVDIRNGAFGSNEALQLTDFQGTASKNSAGSIKNTPSSGWYSVVFGNTAFTYINLSGVTQFRLRFQTDDDNDVTADYLKFYSGNASSSYQPQLIVEYYVP